MLTRAYGPTVVKHPFFAALDYGCFQSVCQNAKRSSYVRGDVVRGASAGLPGILGGSSGVLRCFR